MSFIQDIIIQIVNGVSVSNRQNFGVPVLLGKTGDRHIALFGSGESGFVAKSISRNPVTPISLRIISSGSSFTYSITYTDAIITVPTTARVRDLLADFAVNVDAAAATMRGLFSLVAVAGGSALIAAQAATTLTGIEYILVTDITQLNYYYDTTDLEYKMIGNFLNSSPSPKQIWLLETADTTITAALTAHDTGDYYPIFLAGTAQADQQEITDYCASSTIKHIGIFTQDLTNYAAAMASVKGRAAFLVHDVATDHPEAPWSAKNLVAAPGSNDWKYTTALQGQNANITATPTQLLAVRAANGQSYVKENGISFVDGGWMNTQDGSKLSIANQIARDALASDLTADFLDLYTSYANRQQKVPYTDAGIAIHVNTIAKRLTAYGDAGYLAPATTAEQLAKSYDGKYQYNIVFPTYAQIVASSPADIVNQVLKGIVANYVESGAIGGVEATGRVVLTL